MAVNGHWQFNLYNAMEDSSVRAYSDQTVVIIRDKYPKSELHFLVLPWERIVGVRYLNGGHLEMLHHMEYITESFIENYPGRTFWLGFHANPTMVQLHLHVISDDFRGSGLKTAKHWNSFTTSFFVPLSQVKNDLQRYGRVMLPQPPVCQNMLKAPLVCHKCGHRPLNMPSLKVHLLSHIAF